ncbi:hypothetical protein SEA_GODONK_95 [Gordonia phage GodonK]|uniref:Minor tail protein n=1 Tax=Gordonia phage GodonK TaxID=2562192 RepID=A0A4D6E2I0_9CAUD|nr:hypothetical protein HOV33_gp095 [Gordonia phage GodonK]QBZ72714.1 hypothetical protein SEA_GODONK_95 [Gordonia phage GodonK]
MVEFEARERDVLRDERYHRVDADVRFKKVHFEDRGAYARIGEMIAGVLATGVGVAHPGTVTAGRSVTVTGVTATGVGTGHPGNISTNEIIPGTQAVGVGVAHPGTVTTTRVVNIAGPVAVGVGAVGAGTTVAAIRNASVAGNVATATANAFVGVATAIRNKIVSGVVAQAVASAPAGEVATTS